MFEADYAPSSWDDEDGQRRHLDGTTKTATTKASTTATTTKAPAAAKDKTTAAKTDTLAALIK